MKPILFSGHYHRNRSTLGIGVLGCIGIVSIRNTLLKSGTFLLGHPVYIVYYIIYTYVYIYICTCVYVNVFFDRGWFRHTCNGSWLLPQVALSYTHVGYVPYIRKLRTDYARQACELSW